MAYYEGVLDRERPGWREVGDPKDEGGAVHRVVPGIKWWEAAVAVRTRAVTGSGGMAPYCRVVRTGLRRVMLPVCCELCRQRRWIGRECGEVALEGYQKAEQLGKMAECKGLKE